MTEYDRGHLHARAKALAVVLYRSTGLNMFERPGIVLTFNRLPGTVCFRLRHEAGSKKPQVIFLSINLRLPVMSIQLKQTVAA